MATVPFALSVHSLVTSVGTDVAFAAIIGLALLALLYFAQARETASLRERLDNAAQWIEAMESRLNQLQRSQAAAAQRPPGAPAPAPAGAGVQRLRPGQPIAPRPAGAPVPAGAVPAGVASGTARPMGGSLLGAPAGMGAPALAAATHLIPLAGPSTDGPAPDTGDGEDQETRIEAPAAGAVPGAEVGEGSPASDDTILAMPAPATAAALANGQGSGVVAAPPAPRPTFAAAPAGGGSPAAGSGRAASRPGGNGGPAPAAAALSARSGGSRPLPPMRTTVPSEPSRARRLVPILIGLAVVVVVVVALLIITHNNQNSTTVHRSNAVSAKTQHNKSAAVTPSAVTVAVLNGTGVTNLAHDVANRLGAGGYKEGAIATAADQTHTGTIVGYLPGHQADARAVAAVLNLKASSVTAVDPQAMGVACPGASGTTTSSASSCAADVVVTVGSDLAGLASSGTG
ncbi:MAG TPA: LytR C-terminal domain-containing protein [Solirubrobacteraceae bacterium]|jgi:hypothetical protein|nr:LytR C-terminal domain-containing protein [Solirubrobacteraceae bacterium]